MECTVSVSSKVNTLIYSIGDQADDILRLFTLSEEDQENHSMVRDRFE